MILVQREPSIGTTRDTMEPVRLTTALTLAGLISMMLSMGLRVTLQDLFASMRKPRIVFAGLVANFVLVPLATIGLLYLFDANPLVSAGFLILAVCPGAPIGPPFAAIARGDVPCAVGQMVILCGLSAVVSPLLLSALLSPLIPDGDLRVDAPAIVRILLVSQLLPLGIGLGGHWALPELSRRVARPFGLLANGLLLGVMGLVLAREYPALELIRPRGWFGMLLLLAMSLGIGWLCGGPAGNTRRAMALTTATRNAAVALVIVSNNFGGTPAVTAVVAYSIVSILGSLGSAVLLGILCR